MSNDCVRLQREKHVCLLLVWIVTKLRSRI